MPRRVVQAGDRMLTVAMDDPLAAGLRSQAIVWTRVTDELTGLPPRTPLRITSPTIEPATVETPAFLTRVGEGGLAGLAGVPRQVFPRLNLIGYTTRFTVRAEGYVPRAVPIDVPPDPTFPETYSAPNPTPVELHREPVVIAGRVMAYNAGGNTPLPNTTVRVTFVWNTTPPASASVPPDAADLVFLPSRLYADRPIAATQCAAVPLTIAGTDVRLTRGAGTGQRSLHLSDRTGMTAGTILQIDGDDLSRSEWLAIESTGSAPPPPMGGTVTLRFPAARDHREQCVVRRLTAGAAGGARLLTRDATTGDSAIFLDSLAGLSTGDILRVRTGVGPAEFHRVERYEVTSDSEGFYRLPPIARVGQVRVTADHAGFASADADVQLDYTTQTNRQDFVLN